MCGFIEPHLHEKFSAIPPFFFLTRSHPSVLRMPTMNRREIKKRMDAAAERYTKTRDPRAQEEVAQLSYELAKLSLLEVLEDALKRCRTTDMRTRQVYQAIAFLERRASPKWPFEQFRKALENKSDETRRQLMDDSLSRIKLSLGLNVAPEKQK